MVDLLVEQFELYPHQQRALDATRDLSHVAYYHDMGLGKTFTGAEKAMSLGEKILVICQRSKVGDWIEHFSRYYDVAVWDLTKKDGIECFMGMAGMTVGVINYDLIFRRPSLSGLTGFTLLLDESSLIQNESSKRAKFILKELRPNGVVLLSGTPTGGKYERLWSQMHLLGWSISKRLYWQQFVITETINTEGFPIKIVRGYRNVERLKSKMRQYGCDFLRTDEVFDLPSQTFIEKSIQPTKEYRRFCRSRVVDVDGETLVGDTILKALLYSRMLCAHYNRDKAVAFSDILESTSDRVVVFYNFDAELRVLTDICGQSDRPLSVVNGSRKDLTSYETRSDSVTAIQYQAGSMGLNLQLANIVVYFSPTLSSELYEQSKKRIHRIGQSKACYYYRLVCGIEARIYDALERRRDYTEDLFVKDNP